MSERVRYHIIIELPYPIAEPFKKVSTWAAQVVQPKAWQDLSATVVGVVLEKSDG